VPQAADANESTVETAPLRCWWRSSTGAITIGEPFDVRLTCAVLETDTVQVVADEATLAPAGVQLPPFEVIGGERPPDERAGQRRFFQYRYTLRLVDSNEIGQDVSLPRLPITYKIQSRVAANATVAGRDFTYMMPDVSIKVASLVPEDATDIRDGTDVGLERVQSLMFRARLADIVSLALLASGLLLAGLTVVAVVERVRAPRTRARAHVSDRRVLVAAADELSRVDRDAAGGWTPELVSAAHAALRVVAAIALGRPVNEQTLARGESAPNGRIAVRGRLPRRPAVAVGSPVTAADVAVALRDLSSDTSADDRTGLESLHEGLRVFTRYRYGPTDAAGDTGDHGDLSRVTAAGRDEALRLASAQRWPWQRRRVAAGSQMDLYGRQTHG
jgi:hypothetical protein